MLGLLLLATNAQASFTTPLNIKQCTASGCTVVKKRVALDATSNHTSSTGRCDDKNSFSCWGLWDSRPRSAARANPTRPPTPRTPTAAR